MLWLSFARAIGLSFDSEDMWEVNLGLRRRVQMEEIDLSTMIELDDEGGGGIEESFVVERVFVVSSRG